MAKFDIRSGLLPKYAFDVQAISTDTTTTGAIIDTKDYDRGIVFTLLCSAYTDGTYTPLLEEGDDSGLSDATAVPDANLIGTEAGAALSAVDAEGSTLNSLGAFGTKRYLRLSIVSTSTSTGATVGAVFHGATEVQPASGLSA